MNHQTIESSIRFYFKACHTPKKYALRDALHALKALDYPILIIGDSTVDVAVSDSECMTLNINALWEDVYPDVSGLMQLAAIATVCILALGLVALDIPSALSLAGDWLALADLWRWGLPLLNGVVMVGCLVWLLWRSLFRLLKAVSICFYKEAPHAA
ncbi:hypothetical protein N4G41_24910 [Kosakonia sacchari]|uniref:hypothetical protein n=1 Tax=Kosakonia sacchari TaxID=1158459 RepID=UPI002ACF02CE|nr:hypothetical protein [Kosakonia sacchari]MDZ7324876.1 hypothetical protein [Kosakonia sacchari]